MPPSKTPCLRALLAALLLLVASGATCRHWTQPPAAHYGPPAFTAPPTLDQVIAAVHGNTQRVRQLQTDNASLTVSGLPRLRASIAAEPPRRLRLTAKLIGPELDLGSNDELFWFWVKSDPDKALYFARHEDYARASAARPLPVEPQWLLEALGLVWLDADALHEGPFPSSEGYFQIRSRLHSPSGPLTRVLVIDDTYGWIVQQTISDERGQLLASVNASNHRHDPVSGATLPHSIAVELPAARLSLRIDVASYTINQLYSDPAELWEMPRMEGYQLVDLAGHTERQVPVQLGPSAGSVPQFDYPRSGFRPSYRGYTRFR